MLTRVVAKQAKTTKVKNKFVDGKKKVQKNTQLSFWWNGKVPFKHQHFLADRQLVTKKEISIKINF